jgi:hypothetical protein
MFRNDLLKLSVTLVLLVATAFVSVTVVAADPWYPTKAGDTAVASDWFERHPSSILSGDAAFASDWIDRHPSSILSGDAAFASDWYARHSDIGMLVNAADLSDYFQRHPSSIFSGDVAGSLMKYGPPGR